MRTFARVAVLLVTLAALAIVPASSMAAPPKNFVAIGFKSTFNAPPVLASPLHSAASRYPTSCMRTAGAYLGVFYTDAFFGPVCTAAIEINTFRFLGGRIESARVHCFGFYAVNFDKVVVNTKAACKPA